MLKPRLSHCRFKNNRPSKKDHPLDKVVTIVWTFDGNYLRYGATVFKKTGSTDFWIKKEHRKKAVERYETIPVTVEISFHCNFEDIDPLAIDWYIAENLIYKYGCSNEEKFIFVKDVYNYELTLPFTNITPFRNLFLSSNSKEKESQLMKVNESNYTWIYYVVLLIIFSKTVRQFYP